MNVRRYIPEYPGAGRLGRHVNHDPRSLNYHYPYRVVTYSSLISIRHQRYIPVLDQGNLGSCTGNAAEGSLGTGELFVAIPDDLTGKPSMDDPSQDEDQAVSLYSRATDLDDYSGTYPPDDTGSDGLSVAKAAKEFGLISGYTHCTDLNSALAALSHQSVIMGLNWYDSFDEPDSSGYIRITPSSQVRGGHEVVLDELDAEKQLVWLTNSWGESWGAAGRACMSYDTLDRLLSEDGDVTVFTPLTSPAPVPTPTPAPPSGCLDAIVRAALRALSG